MYSYEDRLRAVQLYIKLGKRIGLTPGGHPMCPTYGHSNCSTWPG